MSTTEGRKMEQNSIVTVVLTLVTALTSAKGWEYWQNKRADKKEEKQQELEDTHLYRNDLRKEVQRLRKELIGLYAKREEEMQKMHQQIAELREGLAAFKTRVEFLEQENSELKAQINSRA